MPVLPVLTIDPPARKADVFFASIPTVDESVGRASEDGGDSEADIGSKFSLGRLDVEKEERETLNSRTPKRRVRSGTGRGDGEDDWEVVSADTTSGEDG